MVSDNYGSWVNICNQVHRWVTRQTQVNCTLFFRDNEISRQPLKVSTNSFVKIATTQYWCLDTGQYPSIQGVRRCNFPAFLVAMGGILALHDTRLSSIYIQRCPDGGRKGGLRLTGCCSCTTDPPTPWGPTHIDGLHAVGFILDLLDRTVNRTGQYMPVVLPH